MTPPVQRKAREAPAPFVDSPATTEPSAEIFVPVESPPRVPRLVNDCARPWIETQTAATVRKDFQDFMGCGGGIT